MKPIKNYKILIISLTKMSCYFFIKIGIFYCLFCLGKKTNEILFFPNLVCKRVYKRVFCSFANEFFCPFANENRRKQTRFFFLKFRLQTEKTNAFVLPVCSEKISFVCFSFANKQPRFFLFSRLFVSRLQTSFLARLQTKS